MANATQQEIERLARERAGLQRTRDSQRRRGTQNSRKIDPVEHNLTVTTQRLIGALRRRIRELTPRKPRTQR